MAEYNDILLGRGRCRDNSTPRSTVLKEQNLLNLILIHTHDHKNKRVVLFLIECSKAKRLIQF